MIWIPKVLVDFTLYSQSLWEFLLHQENLLEPLLTSNPPPTLPSPLTWAKSTEHTEHAPRSFKQQPGQGQCCEMVKTFVKRKSLPHIHISLHTIGFFRASQTCKTCSMWGDRLEQVESGNAFAISRKKRGKQKSCMFACYTLLPLSLSFCALSLMFRTSCYRRWFMPHKVQKIPWWLHAVR